MFNYNVKMQELIGNVYLKKIWSIIIIITASKCNLKLEKFWN